MILLLPKDPGVWTPAPDGVRDHHHICDNLWLGGFPHERWGGPDKFKTIINVSEMSYERKWSGQLILTHALYDHLKLPDEQEMKLLVSVVNQARHLGPTLVHCWQGLNRSGLIAGLALRHLGPNGGAGLDGPAVIKLLRTKRTFPDIPAQFVLCNPTFAKYVETMTPWH